MVVTMGGDGKVVASRDFAFDATRALRSAGRLAGGADGDRRSWLPPVNPTDRFNHQVLSAVAHADRIAIFGPDNAKYDLDLLIRKRGALFEKVVGLKGAEEMNHAKFAGQIRNFYSLRPAGRHSSTPPGEQEDTMVAGA